MAPKLSIVRRRTTSLRASRSLEGPVRRPTTKKSQTYWNTILIVMIVTVNARLSADANPKQKRNLMERSRLSPRAHLSTKERIKAREKEKNSARKMMTKITTSIRIFTKKQNLSKLRNGIRKKFSKTRLT